MTASGQILSGMGRFDFSTKSTGKLIPVEPMEFTLEGAAETQKARKFKDGTLVTSGTVISSTEYTMTVGIEAASWLALQFAYGELAGVTASASLPELRYGTVPATPFEVVDADIASGNVQVTLLGDEPEPLAVITTGTVADGQVRVDTAANKLIFHSSDAGKSFAYRLFKTYTNLQSIGVETVYEVLSSFSFSGLLYTGEGLVKLVIPEISKIGVPTLNPAEVTKLDVEFELLTSGTNRSAFQLYRMPDNYQPA
jgi:hypothetical protein